MKEAAEKFLNTKEIELKMDQEKTEQNLENERLIEKLQTQLREKTLSAALDLALVKAKARKPETVLPLLKNFLNDAEIDEKGQVIGLNEAVMALARGEKTGFLFEQPEKQTEFAGFKPVGDVSQVPAVDLAGMNYQQLCEHFNG